jgi:hypothetical protein
MLSRLEVREKTMEGENLSHADVVIVIVIGGSEPREV